MDKVVFVGAARECGHPKVCAVRHLDLDFFAFTLLNQVVGGAYGIGGRMPDFSFLHSEAFKPSGGDLRLELMEYPQSRVLRIRHLKDDVGGMCRTSSMRSP